jgi:hypothetical protein
MLIPRDEGDGHLGMQGTAEASDQIIPGKATTLPFPCLGGEKRKKHSLQDSKLSSPRQFLSCAICKKTS